MGYFLVGITQHLALVQWHLTLVSLQLELQFLLHISDMIRFKFDTLFTLTLLMYAFLDYILTCHLGKLVVVSSLSSAVSSTLRLFLPLRAFSKLAQIELDHDLGQQQAISMALKVSNPVFGFSFDDI